jgi:nucleotide-binding universal stress UspA family protein
MKILFATDGSDASEKAATFLSRLRLTADDQVTIIHAISWIPVMSEWEYIYDNLKSIKEDVAPKILESTSNIVKTSKAQITTLSVDDYPDRAITDKASELNVDLIVLGTKGLRGITSLIAGSVTRSVAIRSAKPVLAVQPREKEVSKKMKIVFATDGSPNSNVVTNILSSLPFPDNSELIILSVMPIAYLDIPERFSIEVNDQMKKIVADIKEKESTEAGTVLDDAAKKLQSKFSHVEKTLRYGDPPVEILSVADEYNADIIAVGSSGMRGIKGMVGSVARYILNHATCSVLIGKSG